MKISVVNHTGGTIKDEEVQRVIRAINRQIKEDFEPYWGMSATLRLEGRSTDTPNAMELPDLRGDAVIYLWNDTDVPGALGYHEKNAMGIPFGFVFTKIAKQIGEDWSTTLSHEALELIGDAETNLLVMGPHPSEERDVFHWFEMCDAVQAETYEIDGVTVSNFVLPLYFTGTRDTDEVGARNDFLGTPYRGQTLRSFGINPGGYVGFFDPEKNDHDTFSIRGDKLALKRLKFKSAGKQTRRSVRYRSFQQRNELRLAAGGRSVAAAARVRLTRTTAAAVAKSKASGRDYCSMLEDSSASTRTPLKSSKPNAIVKTTGTAGKSARSMKKK